MRSAYALLLLVAGIGQAEPASGPMRFEATADSVRGITAKGTVTHQGVVAADPAVLPLGSVIRVSGAGAYSGVYVVTDTGSKVVGRKIDIYMHSAAAAKQFGKKAVIVRVIRRGHNRRNHLEVTPANRRVESRE